MGGHFLSTALFTQNSATGFARRIRSCGPFGDYVLFLASKTLKDCVQNHGTTISQRELSFMCRMQVVSIIESLPPGRVFSGEVYESLSFLNGDGL